MISAPVTSAMDTQYMRLCEHSSAQEAAYLGTGTDFGSNQPISWGWLITFIAVGTALRAIALNQQLWFDEIVTLIDYARQPLLAIVTKYEAQNQHMLYSILAHGSIRIFGEHAWALRLPAVIFGVASIPSLYFFGRTVTSESEARFAAALLAINYQHVWFSQNARGYTGMLFCTIVASIFLIRSAKRRKASDWIFYALFSALGIYTHLTMAFVVAGQALAYLWLLVSERPAAGLRRDFVRPVFGFVFSGLISISLYAPVISQMFTRTVGEGGKSVRSEWTSPLWAALEALKGLRTGADGSFLALMIAGVIFLVGLASYWQENRFLLSLVILPGIVTCGAILATRHNLWPRFFFFEIGFGMLFLVRGVSVCCRAAGKLLDGGATAVGRLSTVALILLLLGSCLPLRAEYSLPKQDFLQAMNLVDSERQASESVVTLGMVTTAYQRYYGRSWPLIQNRSQLDAELSRSSGTWLIYAMPIAIRASQPDVWQDVQEKFALVHVFPGTLRGGEIYVCRSKDHGRSIALAQSIK